MVDYKTDIIDKTIKKITTIRGGEVLEITKDYIRTWIDSKGNPYKYEFRGNNFTAYLDPRDVIITK